MNELSIIMLRTIARLRILQLYYHYCHNLTYGANFISDHEMFAGFYGEIEKNYDSVVEYLIATAGNGALDTSSLNKAVMSSLSELKVENMNSNEMFIQGLKLEAELYIELESLDEVGSIGIKNLVGDIAEISDARKYKIQQRLKGK